MRQVDSMAGWNYDRAELRADGIVHVIGVSLALIGSLVVIVVALGRPTLTGVVGAVIYAVCLPTTLILSALYNMWPAGARKRFLRHLDHAGIFLLIAGTYTPFTLHLGPVGERFLIAIWGLALLGMGLKLCFTGLYDRLATLLYLALGWSGLALLGAMTQSLSPLIVGLVLGGGVVYSIGVPFHLWERLRFQNVIWHGFVLAGAATHYSAVLLTVTALSQTAQ